MERKFKVGDWVRCRRETGPRQILGINGEHYIVTPLDWPNPFPLSMEYVDNDYELDEITMAKRIIASYE